MSERLTICDKESIAKVKQYEKDHGYDRDTDTEFRIFDVVVGAQLISTDTRTYRIIADTEDEAVQKALKMADNVCWEPDEFSLDDISVDDISEL